jgi:hypothetical protein
VSFLNSATASTGLAAKADEMNKVSEAITNKTLRIVFSCGLCRELYRSLARQA